MAMCAGFKPGRIIGISPRAKYLLAKTENLAWERRIEEDCFAAAVEWLEARGCDIATASLGYYNMDSTEATYLAENLDGHSTVCALSVNRAVQNGVIFIVSAGNTGPSNEIMSTPADADSAITVGAVISDGKTPWGGSSRGPGYPQRQKPDVTCLGYDAFTLDSRDTSGYIHTSGTSLSAPQIAGVAALILTAHPELKTYEVRKLIYDYSNNAENIDLYPNYEIGRGTPNAFRSICAYSLFVSQPLSPYLLAIKNPLTREIKFKVHSKENLISAVLHATNQSNISKDFDGSFSHNGENYIVTFTIPMDFFDANSIKFYCDFHSVSFAKRMPVEVDEFYTLIKEESLIPCGMDQDINSDITEVKDDTEENSIVISPDIVSSSNSSVQVHIKKDFQTGITFEIYDCSGKQLTSGHNDIYNSNIVINVDNYPNSVYFIRLICNRRNYFKSFIVVR